MSCQIEKKCDTLADVVDERVALLESLNSDREREQARDRAINAREAMKV